VQPSERGSSRDRGRKRGSVLARGRSCARRGKGSLSELMTEGVFPRETASGGPLSPRYVKPFSLRKKDTARDVGGKFSLGERKEGRRLRIKNSARGFQAKGTREKKVRSGEGKELLKRPAGLKRGEGSLLINKKEGGSTLPKGKDTVVYRQKEERREGGKKLEETTPRKRKEGKERKKTGITPKQRKKKKAPLCYTKKARGHGSPTGSDVFPSGKVKESRLHPLHSGGEGRIVFPLLKGVRSKCQSRAKGKKEIYVLYQEKRRGREGGGYAGLRGRFSFLEKDLRRKTRQLYQPEGKGPGLLPIPTSTRGREALLANGERRNGPPEG